MFDSGAGAPLARIVGPLSKLGVLKRHGNHTTHRSIKTLSANATLLPALPQSHHAVVAGAGAAATARKKKAKQGPADALRYLSNEVIASMCVHASTHSPSSRRI